MFKPAAAAQMTTPCMLLSPVESNVLGVHKKDYPQNGEQFNCNWKSYGGTEVANNGVLTIEDTATLVCWYNPAIRANCRIVRLADGKDEAGKWRAGYEIMGEPENIEQRNMILQFKVRRVKGGA